MVQLTWQPLLAIASVGREGGRAVELPRFVHSLLGVALVVRIVIIISMATVFFFTLGIIAIITTDTQIWQIYLC